jgi:hypothetical protein
MSMKGNRSVGQTKSPPRFPVSALTTEHLSAVAAFERWQRESPHPDAVTAAGDRTTDPVGADQPLKN